MVFNTPDDIIGQLGTLQLDTHIKLAEKREKIAWSTPQ